jgi:hypothetical protein
MAETAVWREVESGVYIPGQWAAVGAGGVFLAVGVIALPARRRPNQSPPNECFALTPTCSSNHRLVFESRHHQAHRVVIYNTCRRTPANLSFSMAVAVAPA